MVVRIVSGLGAQPLARSFNTRLARAQVYDRATRIKPYRRRPERYHGPFTYWDLHDYVALLMGCLAFLYGGFRVGVRSVLSLRAVAFIAVHVMGCAASVHVCPPMDSQNARVMLNRLPPAALPQMRLQPRAKWRRES